MPFMAEGLPQPKETSFAEASLLVGSRTEFIVPQSFVQAFKASVESFRRTLASLPSSEERESITLKIVSADGDALLPKTKNSLRRQGGYWLNVSKDGITIFASDQKGALNGLSTLEQYLMDGKGYVKEGQVWDWPSLSVRAFHIQLQEAKKVGPLMPGEIQRLIRAARLGHYNTLIIQIDDGVKFDTMKKIARADAWTKEEFSDVVRYAKENGLDVIPELKLLTHQEKLLNNKYPQLMYNKVTYDPRKEETYQVVLPMVDEVISLIKPRAMHIGHDEVAGYNAKSRARWLGPDQKMLPPDLFLKDVLRLYSYFSGKGLETWMWGDMLISPAEFPDMPATQLHGIDGYAAIRGRIPRDIVICDWHYYGRQTRFPTLLAFKDAGHGVLGATFKNSETTRNFSRYAADVGAQGMIGTTWGFVPRKQWEEVQRLLDVSAEAFWNADSGE
jgi:hypothetical protein